MGAGWIASQEGARPAVVPILSYMFVLLLRVMKMVEDP